MKKLIITATTLLLAASACNDTTTVYHTYRPIPAKGWQRTDTLVYNLTQPLHSPSAYTFRLGIRHKDTYPYRDIWLEAGQDTLHIALADSIGNWQGSGIGDTRLYTTPVTLTHTQRQDTLRHIHIRHIMKDEPLQGIIDIGVEISVPHDPHPSSGTQTEES